MCVRVKGDEALLHVGMALLLCVTQSHEENRVVRCYELYTQVIAAADLW